MALHSFLSFFFSNTCSFDSTLSLFYLFLQPFSHTLQVGDFSLCYITTRCRRSSFSTTSCLFLFPIILAPLWVLFAIVILVLPSICSKLSSRFSIFLCAMQAIIFLHSFLSFVSISNTCCFIIPLCLSCIFPPLICLNLLNSFSFFLHAMFLSRVWSWFSKPSYLLLLSVILASLCNTHYFIYLDKFVKQITCRFLLLLLFLMCPVSVKFTKPSFFIMLPQDFSSF